MGLDPSLLPENNPYRREVPWYVGPNAASETLATGLSGAIGNWNTQDQAKIPFEKTAADLGQTGPLATRMSRMGLDFDAPAWEQAARDARDMDVYKSILSLPGVSPTVAGLEGVTELGNRQLRRTGKEPLVKPKVSGLNPTFQKSKLVPFTKRMDEITKRRSELRTVSPKDAARESAELDKLEAQVRERYLAAGTLLQNPDPTALDLAQVDDLGVLDKMPFVGRKVSPVRQLVEGEMKKEYTPGVGTQWYVVERGASGALGYVKSFFTGEQESKNTIARIKNSTDLENLRHQHREKLLKTGLANDKDLAAHKSEIEAQYKNILTKQQIVEASLAAARLGLASARQAFPAEEFSDQASLNELGKRAVAHAGAVAVAEFKKALDRAAAASGSVVIPRVIPDPNAVDAPPPPKRTFVAPPIPAPTGRK